MDWREDPNKRANYLWFADHYYLATRLLVLSGHVVAAAPIAALCVEQYLKLRTFELLADQGSSFNREHNLEKLFQAIEEPMRINGLNLKPFSHYKSFLIMLSRAWKNKYHDEKGVIGELKRTNNSVGVGMGINALPIFDELCCELRNSLFIGNHGLVDELVNFENKSHHQFKAMHEQNLQFGNFKNRPSLIY